MTSNQIANESNVIRKDELSETERHNKATEDNSREQLRINEMQVNNEAYYRSESNRIQEQYNNAYLELQTAQGQRRLEIEEFLANLKEQQTLNENHYRDQTIINNRVLASLQSDRNKEEARHNLATEQFGQTQNFLREKELEQAKYQFRETQMLKRAELAQQLKLKTMDIENAQLLTTQNNLASYHRMEGEMKAKAEIAAADRSSREAMAAAALEEQKKEHTDTLIQGYVNTATGAYQNGVNNATRIITGILPYLF